MSPFAGFPNGKLRLTPIPGQFFTDLLPEIDHLGELKICLYAIWKLDRMEGEFRYLRREDFASDAGLISGLAASQRQADLALDDALERAVGRGFLLRLDASQEQGSVVFYFLNSARGRAAVAAAQQGTWQPSPQGLPAPQLNQERPNIFRLYEENIGPLTPMIAEMLRDAEREYPADWIEDAVRVALQRNARNWRYVEAVLAAWKEKGRDEQDRRESQKDRRRYNESEFADFIEH